MLICASVYGKMGEITGVATTVLAMVETMGLVVLVDILGGLINSAVFMVFVLVFE